MKTNLTHKNPLAAVAGVMVALFLFFAFPARAFAATYYTVKVNSGYLALRNYPSYDERNEIGELYTGDVVQVLDTKSNSNYWWVQSSKYTQPGWVNKDYLVFKYCDGYEDGSNCSDTNPYAGKTYQVSVKSGYLALRTSPCYDDRNEIGQLYNYDTVTFVSVHDNTYWLVYSPKYGREGFVNRNYLIEEPACRPSYPNSYGTYTVVVNQGYLALRTAPSYNEANEIGELYTGDRVIVLGKPSGDYWWVYSYKYNREGYVNKHYLTYTCG